MVELLLSDITLPNIRTSVLDAERQVIVEDECTPVIMFFKEVANMVRLFVIAEVDQQGGINHMSDVEVICRGEFFHDGLRHLWWGNPGEHSGYLYFPDLDKVRKVVDRLGELEKQWCPNL